ncbi:uncharacterized protein LOC133727131 [Rosa rugosa]|uniref:uncharacterized protein LOC133727131 n=1 Tax=Rosa rugosa TaxID=74645 RepID=UPI002B404797|nr:uncharacterized protein LOC133727131 [Rosa rugosa]
MGPVILLYAVVLVDFDRVRIAGVVIVFRIGISELIEKALFVLQFQLWAIDCNTFKSLSTLCQVSTRSSNNSFFTLFDSSSSCDYVKLGETVTQARRNFGIDFWVRAAELRQILVELRPAYIKIAQAISSRPGKRRLPN